MGDGKMGKSIDTHRTAVLKCTDGHPKSIHLHDVDNIDVVLVSQICKFYTSIRPSDALLMQFIYDVLTHKI